MPLPTQDRDQVAILKKHVGIQVSLRNSNAAFLKDFFLKSIKDEINNIYVKVAHFIERRNQIKGCYVLALMEN